MGDRVTVFVLVRPEQAEQAAALLECNKDSIYYSDFRAEAEIEIPEVNYADITAESQMLTDAGIAHTWSYDAGGEYGAGYGYVIFNKVGEAIRHEYTQEDTRISCEDLIKYIDEGKGTDELKNILEDHAAQNSQPDLTTDQLEWAKRFMLRQAVLPASA